MLLRFALLAALALGFALEVSAQITLTADQAYPYGLGTNTVVAYENDETSDSAAINALAAQSGPNQTWDFSSLGLIALQATATVTPGATGPGASQSPFDQAMRTYQVILPPETDDDGNTVEGTVYGYSRTDSDGLHILGVYLESRFGSETFSLVTTNLPSGVLVAPPTFTFGSTWESTYVEDLGFFGQTNQRTTYEVDGWGTLIAPSGVSTPALRLKVTDIDLDDGGEGVTYEFRTAIGIGAFVDPEDDGFAPTASLTVSTPGGSTSTGDAPDGGLEVGAPWPNPARATVALEVTAPRAETVRIAVYDVLGREAIAPTSRTISAGTSRVDLDTSDLPAGVYVVRVEVEGRAFARSLTVVR